MKTDYEIFRVLWPLSHTSMMVGYCWFWDDHMRTDIDQCWMYPRLMAGWPDACRVKRQKSDHSKQKQHFKVGWLLTDTKIRFIFNTPPTSVLLWLTGAYDELKQNGKEREHPTRTDKKCYAAKRIRQKIESLKQAIPYDIEQNMKCIRLLAMKPIIELCTFYVSTYTNLLLYFLDAVHLPPRWITDFIIKDICLPEKCHL